MSLRAASCLLVLLAAACGDTVAAAPKGEGQGGAPPVPAPPAPADPAPAPELKIEVVGKGEGRVVKKGDWVLAHVSLTLAGGGKTLFDSRKEGEPQPMRAGESTLIPALDRTLPGMRAGDRWKIHAPWQHAWGEKGHPQAGIPAKADVLIDVEIVGFIDIPKEVVKEGAGPFPQPGEYVVVHYTGTLKDGTVFDDSRKDGVPFVFTLGAGRVIPGWEIVVPQMRVGERAKFTIPWQFAYGQGGRPPIIPSKADLVFDIERLPLPEIKVEVLAEGKGAQTVPGRPVNVHYTGTLLDGTKFDSSRDKGRPFTFVLGAQQVIAGWDLIVARMRVGDRWKVTIPAALAYGARGQGTIPPKADLVFDIEVL